MSDIGEDVLAQPLSPQQLLILLTGRREAATPAGEGHQDTPAALATPQPNEAVLEKAALEELPQHPLDHHGQGALALREALRPQSQELIEKLKLDSLIEIGAVFLLLPLWAPAHPHHDSALDKRRKSYPVDSARARVEVIP
jgi:hypothetical protein